MISKLCIVALIGALSMVVTSEETTSCPKVLIRNMEPSEYQKEMQQLFRWLLDDLAACEKKSNGQEDPVSQMRPTHAEVLMKLQSQISSLEQKQNELEAEHKSQLESIKAEKDQEITKLLEEKQKIGGDLTEILEKSEIKSKLIRELKMTHQEKPEQLQSQVSSCEKRLVESESSIERIRSEVKSEYEEQLKSVRIEKGDEVNRISEEKQKIETELQKIKLELSNKSAEVEKRSRFIRKLKRESKELQSKVSSFETRLVDSEKKQSELETKCEKQLKSVEAEEVNKLLEEKQTIESNLAKELVESANKTKLIEQLKEKHREESEKLRGQVGSCEKRLVESESSVGKIRSELKTEYEEQVHSVITKEVREKTTKLLEEKQTIEKNWAQEHDEIRNKTKLIEDLQVKVNKFVEENKRISTELSESKNLVEKKQNELNTLKEECERQLESMSSKKLEADLAKDLEENEKKSKIIEELQTKVNEFKEVNEKISNKLDKKRARLVSNQTANCQSNLSVQLQKLADLAVKIKKENDVLKEELRRKQISTLSSKHHWFGLTLGIGRGKTMETVLHRPESKTIDSCAIFCSDLKLRRESPSCKGCDL